MGLGGVIAGSGGNAPRGIAPGARIVAIRLSDGTGNVAWTSQVISALDWIAASPLHVDAVNTSFAVGFLSNGPKAMIARVTMVVSRFVSQAGVRPGADSVRVSGAAALSASRE